VLRLFTFNFAINMALNFSHQDNKKVFYESGEEPGMFSGIALDYELDHRGFESQQELGIFLLTTAFRQDLESTNSPIQWIPGALSLGVKRPGREAHHSPPSSNAMLN
jgi:hypothetical protein